MRYTVDGWDPAYGVSLELEEYLQESSANVAVDLELPASEWHPIDVRTGIPAPEAMLFVDGVRRIEARVWIDSPGDQEKRPPARRPTQPRRYAPHTPPGWCAAAVSRRTW